MKTATTGHDCVCHSVAAVQIPFVIKLEHHCYSIQRHINHNNIYYKLCAPTDDISFIDVQYTSLLVFYRVSVK